jgi:hypothetical protein
MVRSLREPPGIDTRLPASLVHREAGIACHPMGRTQPPCTGVWAACPAILTYRSKEPYAWPASPVVAPAAIQHTFPPTFQQFLEKRLGMEVKTPPKNVDCCLTVDAISLARKVETYLSPRYHHFIARVRPMFQMLHSEHFRVVTPRRSVTRLSLLIIIRVIECINCRFRVSIVVPALP